MSKRLAVEHRQRVAVEEVIRSRYNFVTNQGIEVTSFNAPVARSKFCVQLRNGKAVVSTTSELTAVVPAACRVTEGLSIPSIDTVHRVHSKTPVEAFAAVSNLFSVQPTLMKVESVRLVIERECVASGRTSRSNSAVVTHLNPTAESDFTFAAAAEQSTAAGVAAFSTSIAATGKDVATAT